MSFTKIEEQFRDTISKYSIDDFYIDKGPDFSEVFLNLLTEEDLRIESGYLERQFEIDTVRSDISNFLCEKVQDISAKIVTIKRAAINEKNDVEAKDAEIEQLEKEIKSAIQLNYFVTNHIADVKSWKKTAEVQILNITLQLATTILT